MLLFICSYLDRINIAFAALAMKKDLGLTATMYGLADSIFYIAAWCIALGRSAS